MRTPECFKSFTLNPVEIVDHNGVVAETMDEMSPILDMLAQDVRAVTEIAEWILRDDKTLRADLAAFDGLGLKPVVMGARLKIRVPAEIKGFRVTGASRFESLVLERAITEALSWRERSRVVSGTSTKHISSGWKRTAHAGIPADLTPRMNLGVVNSQYAFLHRDDQDPNVLWLNLVVQRQWTAFKFIVPKRFRDASRITLPVVRITPDGKVEFDFAAAYEYVYTQFSSRYIIGVDVGIKNYATVGVWDVQDQKMVHSTTLSRRVHSLANSVKASEAQRTALRKLGRRQEAAEHRRAASRKKKELAVVAAQEIAHISHEWDNAIVVFEDLSWVKNTMANGRWNRGELVKRTTEFVELNGGRVFKVSSRRTSQECHQCHDQVVFDGWHVVVCSRCGSRMDRDENAVANIAQRASSLLEKALATRSKAKKVTDRKAKRSPDTKPSLKYPCRKTGPTRKQPKNHKKRIALRVPATTTGTVHADSPVEQAGTLTGSAKLFKRSSSSKNYLERLNKKVSTVVDEITHLHHQNLRIVSDFSFQVFLVVIASLLG